MNDQVPSKDKDILKKTAKNTPWILMAVLLHVIGFAVVSVIYITRNFERDDSTATAIQVSGPKKVEELLPVVEPPEVIDRKAVPENQEAELVAFDEASFIPTVEPAPDEDLHLERGDPKALDNLPAGQTGGTAIGVSEAGGHHGTGVPSAYATRFLGGGGGKGRGGGAVQGTEEAVLEGLRWLVRHQNSDGSWGADSVRSHCTPVPCVPMDVGLTESNDIGLTGLALLCFLGAGFTHESRQNVVDTAVGKRYFLGEVIKNGLLWLIDNQNEDGGFMTSGPVNMYNQAIASLAMCEAYGLTGNRNWKTPAAKGIEYLIRAQKVNPKGKGLWGWRYTSRQELDASRFTDGTYAIEMSDADTSVTGWVVMALKSAELSGLTVPHETFDGAMDFMKWISLENGMAGYVDPQQAGLKLTGSNDHYVYHPATMSAVSMLVRTFVVKEIGDPFLEAAAKEIVKDFPAVTPDQLSIDYYYWYYATLALNQFDGPDSPRKSGRYWKPWNEAMVKAILELQDKNQAKDVCSRGGWLVPDRWSHAGGPVYSTAVCTLTLEVYYRYANAFGGEKRK